MIDTPAFLTTGEIEDYGFVVLSAKPVPTKCPLCQKELVRLGVRSLYKNTIISWKENLEPCTCELSVKNEKSTLMKGLLKIEIANKDGNKVLSVHEDSGELYFNLFESDKNGHSISMEKEKFLRLFSRLLNLDITTKNKPEHEPLELMIMW